MVKPINGFDGHTVPNASDAVENNSLCLQIACDIAVAKFMLDTALCTKNS